MKDGQRIGLGIETSCDETSVAVVADGCRELANVVYSQISEHERFRGVVPEIASRAHLEKINHVYSAALEQAGVAPEELDFVAVTNRPGLTGSLMIGVQLARCVALVHGPTLIACDHLEAHFHGLALEQGPLEFPFLGLLLSGGNSSLYLVHGLENMELIGDTADDALGEAFDKAASVMQLAYPGGPAVEACATAYLENQSAARPTGEGPDGTVALDFGRLLKNLPRTELRFSFSGIKTAVLRAARAGLDSGAICAAFQASTFELVERMVSRAVKNTGLRRVIASGGVLANTTLRTRLKAVAGRRRFDIAYPERRLLCTDNAGMVAALGDRLYQAPQRSMGDFDVSSKR